MQKQQGGQTSKGLSSTNPSSKRKQPKKGDRHPLKKPKIFPKPIVGLEVKGKKTVTKLGLGKGKGLMMGLDQSAKKAPILFREDSKYALEQFLSIITINDY